jgi:hypothetical protein
VSKNGSRKPFFPRDKPKSWVVGTASILAGLLVAAPVMISGFSFQIKVLAAVGQALSWCCWIVAVAMWALFITRLIAGHYKGVASRDWNEQIW